MLSENTEIRVYSFLCLGYPPGIEKIFLFPIDVFHIGSDRSHRADHEYHIFIDV